MNLLPKREVALVTGGCGFIGTHLLRKLIGSSPSSSPGLSHRCVSLDLREPENRVSGVEYIQGDARDLKLMGEILHEKKVSVVYHLAATVSVPLCQNDAIESYSNNFGASLTVLEAIKMENQARAEGERDRTSAIKIVFASSAALYGNQGCECRPIDENSVASRFASFYAAQKHASEKAIELYNEHNGIPALIFRFFNVYGHGQDPSSPYSGVITVFVKVAKERRPFHLHNGGIQTRDFISVHDLVRALTTALSMPISDWNAQAINLGSGIPTSVRTLAELIRSMSRSSSDLIDAPPRTGDVLHSLAAIHRAKTSLDFTPTIQLAAGLSELLYDDLRMTG